MGKKRTYCAADLQKAVAAVKNGASYRSAAKRYGVPPMTISDRVKGKYEGNLNLGRPSVLSDDVERDIVKKLKTAALQGFGITRRQLVIKVARICKQLKLKTPFKNGVPGKGWIAGFLRRHPEVKLRTPIGLSTVRARMLNPTVTASYFDTLQTVVSSLGLHNKPQAIWNIDETGVPLTHRPSKVFAESGVKNIPGRVSNNRERVTVLACVNAAGGTIPPMAIVKGKTPKSLNAYNTKLGVPGCVYTYQERAWMEDTLGARWFEDHFLKHCGPERPQLIVLDSHSSHETVGLLEKAKANQITLLAFPPHTTQWLCPLDKTVFGPLSREWNSVCTEFMSESPNNIVSKWEWPRLFNIAYSRAVTANNIISGFRKCGIFPIDMNSVPSEAFAPSQPFDLPLVSALKSCETTHVSSGMSQGVEAPSVSAVGVVGVPAVVEPSDDITATPVNAASGSTTVGPPSTPDVSSLVAQLPEGATVLSAEDFIMSVLTGDVPSTFDDSGNMNISIESPLQLVPVSELEAVNAEFSLPEPHQRPETKNNSRKLTSHRILTSESIIQMKRERAEQKAKAEAEKKCRKEKRQRVKCKKNET